MTRMKERVAIVTGASSGIGHATARRFAAEGAAVVVAARRAERLEQLVAEITAAGGRAVACAGDVADEEHVESLVATAQRSFGGLHVACHVAGTLGAMGPTGDVRREDWQSTLDINLTSAFLVGKHAAPAIARSGGGAIVLTSTFVGHTAGIPGLAAYAASKSGILGLTRALAVEFASAGVRVNALLPGGTDTPMGRTVANTPEMVRAVAALHALGRMATPDEIAGSMLYLASDDSSFTTGICLLADGGVSIHKEIA